MSVLRRCREEDGSIGNQYVHRSLELHPPSFFDDDSNSIHALTRWFSRIHVEGLISKIASGSGRTGANRLFFFSSTGGRARLPRCKNRSTKFIVRLTPTDLLLSLQTLSCRLVRNFSNLLMYLLMGVNFVQIRVTSI
jgi:hypothetical protein